MARQLRWWIVAELLVCGGLAVVYLPPRAAPLFGRRMRQYQEAPYRIRVQNLALSWREAELELQLRAYRERLRPEIARRRQLELPGPALLVDWANPPSDSTRRILIGALDGAWAKLGLGATKISVGVVIAAPPPRRPGEPLPPQSGTAYLLPDSSDRSTCLVFLQGQYWSQRLDAPHPKPDPRFETMLVNGLGPCAFYAKYGSPGRDIARWLGARRYDLALNPRWDRSPIDSAAESFLPDPGVIWYWWQVYQYPPDAVACLAGRSSGCRRVILANAGTTSPPPHFLTTERWWWRRPLVGGDRYLADVARAVGSDRFQRFWNSEQPVDTALAEALRAPVGDWTRSWQEGLVSKIQLGPTLPPLPIVLGLALVMGALGLVLGIASRREVA